jgi:hypothetical protein
MEGTGSTVDQVTATLADRGLSEETEGYDFEVSEFTQLSTTEFTEFSFRYAGGERDDRTTGRAVYDRRFEFRGRRGRTHVCPPHRWDSPGGMDAVSADCGGVFKRTTTTGER